MEWSKLFFCHHLLLSGILFRKWKMFLFERRCMEKKKKKSKRKGNEKQLCYFWLFEAILLYANEDDNCINKDKNFKSSENIPNYLLPTLYQLHILRYNLKALLIMTKSNWDLRHYIATQYKHTCTQTNKHTHTHTHTHTHIYIYIYTVDIFYWRWQKRRLGLFVNFIYIYIYIYIYLIVLN